MIRVPVKSSNLAAVGYDPSTETLEVEFSSGKVYGYAGVPADVAAAMTEAESVGSFFAKNVRGQYESQSLGLAADGA